eukprot:352992_1
MSEFHLLPATTGIRKALEGNGYSLEDIGSTFYLKKEGITIHQIDAGPFSAPFINALVADSGVKAVTGIPLGFNQSNAFSKQGMLGNYSALFKKEFWTEDMSMYDLDVLALKVFTSDKLIDIEYVDHVPEKTVPAPLFIIKSAMVLHR